MCKIVRHIKALTKVAELDGSVRQQVLQSGIGVFDGVIVPHGYVAHPNACQCYSIEYLSWAVRIGFQRKEKAKRSKMEERRYKRSSASQAVHSVCHDKSCPPPPSFHNLDILVCVRCKIISQKKIYLCQRWELEGFPNSDRLGRDRHQGGRSLPLRLGIACIH